MNPKELVSRSYHDVAARFRDTVVFELPYVKGVHKRVSDNLYPCWVPYRDSEIYVDPRDSIGRHLFMYGEYEPATTESVEDCLSPGDVAIDVGTHIGQHLVTMRECVGDEGAVFAFDPHPKSAAYVRKTIQRNGWENVRIFEKALSNERTSETLIENPTNTGGSTLESRPLEKYNSMTSGEAETHQIQKERLSALYPDLGIDRIEVIKIDIEGAEYELLQDLAGIINRIDNIVLEYHSDKLNNSEKREIVDLLTDNGSVKRIGTEEELSPSEFVALEHGSQVVWSRA